MRSLNKAMNLKELREIYAEELERKDKIISKLKEENLLLMKTSIRSSFEKAELNEKVHSLHKKL